MSSKAVYVYSKYMNTCLIKIDTESRQKKNERMLVIPNYFKYQKSVVVAILPKNVFISKGSLLVSVIDFN